MLATRLDIDVVRKNENAVPRCEETRDGKRISTKLRALLLAILFVGVLPAMSLAEIMQRSEPDKKVSIYSLGDMAVKNLFNVGRGYGKKICSDKSVQKKEDIKGKAWGRIRRTCSKFTFGLQSNFTDDPNELYSLCIGGALDACQKELGIEPPCNDLTSCQALLGVPD